MEITGPGRVLQSYLDFYFEVDSTVVAPDVSKNWVEAHYRKLVPLEEQYGNGKLNVKQNVRNGVVSWLFDSLQKTNEGKSALDGFASTSTASPAKKRGRPQKGEEPVKKSPGKAVGVKQAKTLKLKQEVEISLAPVSLRQRFEATVRGMSHYPFLRAKDPAALNAEHPWATGHAGWAYTAADAKDWEAALVAQSHIEDAQKLSPVSPRASASSVADSKLVPQDSGELRVEVRYSTDKVVVVASVPAHMPGAFEVSTHAGYMDLSYKLSAAASLTIGDGENTIVLSDMSCDRIEFALPAQVTEKKRVVFPVGVLIEPDKCVQERLGGFYVFVCDRKKELPEAPRMVF
eukprot:TRINITY_DN116_c0_g1_i1.p1 TRINITY_DN116_c0_g1~~TRINITY_DN116_c0_g1_i1.p1  ORF type:complete len:346 (-),score=63.77 TRINITY_DN116_c0_g1_i1:98-1135(-)